MDEELLKRNTDCVYFLASPLTCKKGADCEYRHNEMARLNPRDCWYWLSGNCHNPTCAFRHPPLDGQTGVSSDSSTPSLPANKTTVPCYFFFNGYCNKGDKCSFLHGPDDSKITVKPVKNDAGSADTIISENKTSTGNKAGVTLAPMESHHNPSNPAPKALLDYKFQPKENLQQPVPKNIRQQSSPKISAYGHKEATLTRSISQYPTEGFVHNKSHLCTEQSSEEQINSHIEPEERWESSPGFDVLVDDGSENIGYEDDPKYLPVLEKEHSELNGQYMGYEFRETVERDNMCSEADNLYEQEMYDRYRCLDNEQALANDRKIPAYSREMLDSILSRKRIQMPAEMAASDRNIDLREHLRRRREINGQHVTGFLRGHESSHLMVQSQENLLRRGIDSRLSRRLTSEVGLNTIASIGEGETLSIADNHSLLRHSQQHRSRKHYREKLDEQQFLSSDVSEKPVSKQRRFFDESATFTGPKTLTEIKEEKKAAQENGLFNSTSADFQDPKPLSEILKDKRRSDCVRDGNACTD